MRRIIAIIGGAILLSLLMCVAFVGLIFYATRGVAEAGHTFMEALRDENYAAAYDQLHPRFRSEFSGPEDFQAFATSESPPFESWRFSSRSVNNSQGELSGRVRLTEGSRPVRLTLEYEDEQERWFVTRFSFRE